MENATDALKMAAAVLMFLLALSVSIISFGILRQTSDVVMNYKDRETAYIEGNLYYETTGTERSVGLETILPTIERAYNENYKIIFNGLEKPIFTKISNSEGVREERYSLDMEYDNDILNSGIQGRKIFFDGIVYHSQVGSPANVTDFYRLYIQTRKVELPTVSLYDQLKTALDNGKTIKEYSGVYYQEDLLRDGEQNVAGTNNVLDTDDEVPDVNKTKKRVITYEIN